MITANGKGGVTVMISNVTYDLDVADQYKEFLIWVTDPDPDHRIGTENFTIDPAITDEKQLALCHRYADFLTDFSERRAKLLKEADTDASVR